MSGLSIILIFKLHNDLKDIWYFLLYIDEIQGFSIVRNLKLGLTSNMF